MAKQADSLMRMEGPDRVHYETGVLLNAEDFIAEQNYHRGRLARALNYVNGSGTLAGLKVRYEAKVEAGPSTTAREEKILIDAGVAIDRIGRLIEVPSSLCLRIDHWYHQQKALDLRQSWNAADALWTGSVAGVVIDIFIRFISCERGKTPTFAQGPFDSIDAVTAARVRDSYQTELVLRKEANPAEPVNPWPDLSAATDAERPALMREAIFDAWEPTTLSLGGADMLDPLPEHAAGQDTTSLLLARLIIPADEAVGDSAPQRRDGEDIQIRNDIRPFVMTSNALARMMGVDINLMTS